MNRKLLLVLILLLSATPSYAEVIFSDNFNNAGYATWDANDGVLAGTGWDYARAYDVTDRCADPPMNPLYGMHGGPGRGGSGYSMAIPRCGMTVNYDGEQRKNFDWSGGTGRYTSWYLSFSIKVDPNINKPDGCAAGFKMLDRMIIKHTACDHTVYFQMYRNGCPGDWLILTDYAPFYHDVLISRADYVDNTWHHIEFHFDTQAQTVSSWLDGAFVTTVSNVVYGCDYLDEARVGIGNTTQETAFQNEWLYLYIDDFVVSTTRNGLPSDWATTPSFNCTISGGTFR